METQTQPIECPACKGDLYLHTQSPTPFYFCASEGCTYQISAHCVRTVPTKFELEQLTDQSLV